MSQKVLDNEQLENVTGGAKGCDQFWVVYKEYGSEDEHEYHYGNNLRGNGEAYAKKWCQENNKRYVRYYITHK